MTRLHFSPREQTARSLSLQVLLRCQEHTAFVQELLDEHLSRSNLLPADRRLATQLTYGVLRRRGTLDALLRPCVSRRREQVEPWLWETLRLGTYQLALLSHIPPHAALFETVELANLAGKPRGKGFLNAVLRSVSSLISDQPAAGPAADALPLEGGQYRRLTRPVFPDPHVQPAEYLAAALSWPRWLATRWLERYGWEECLRLGFWFAGPAPLWLRCNTLRTDRDQFLAALAAANIRAEPGPHPQSTKLLDHAPVAALPGFAEGWFAVQDHSAMQLASALAPEPGARVLDLCAAPGGKTTHLAELMCNQGTIIACDVDEQRLNTLSTLCARLGVTIVEPHLLRPLGRPSRRRHPLIYEDPPPGPFDAILVDVPCSNTGVLGRRPEVRWRLRPDDFRELVSLQTKLLLQAAERIRPGGVIVYSTCSIEPEENQAVVQAVLRVLPRLTLEAEQSQSPGQPGDGGYWARLRHANGN
jgi:16S rRNA (cytosine967-C5)-methyltransferase